MPETVVIKRTINYTVRVPRRNYVGMSEDEIRQDEDVQDMEVDLLTEIEMAVDAKVVTEVTFE